MDQVLTQITADLRGDGNFELVQGGNLQSRPMQYNLTEVYTYPQNQLLWWTAGWIDGWNRTPDDTFVIAADVDGDRSDEILIVNPKDNWTGIMKWTALALHVPWASPSPIDGWHRSTNDSFLAADVDNDGRTELLVTNNADGWTGIFRWDGTKLYVSWASPGPISGPAGSWNRRASDEFAVADYNGQTAIGVTHPEDGWHGVLFWQNNALELVELDQT